MAFQVKLLQERLFQGGPTISDDMYQANHISRECIQKVSLRITSKSSTFFVAPIL